MFTFLKKNLVGLDIGVSGIKAVELSGGKTPRLVAYNRVPLPWQAIVDGEIRERGMVVEAIQTLFENTDFHTKKVAVGTSGNSVITKKITVQKMSEGELNQQLYWEAEQYIPFNINDVNLDYAILGPSNQSGSDVPMMDVILVAARKDYISNLTSILTEAGLSPSVVDLQAFALGNVFEFNYTHQFDASYDSASIIIDFGAGSTKIAVVEGDKTTFTRELKLCGTTCTHMLSEQLGIGIEEAERAKITQSQVPEINAVVSAFLESLSDEINRTLDICLSQGNERVLEGVYVCGGASRTFGLMDKLGKKLPATIHVLNPIQNIAGSGQRMSAGAVRELSYLGAVAIGLALRSQGDS